MLAAHIRCVRFAANNVGALIVAVVHILCRSIPRMKMPLPLVTAATGVIAP
jgi:hypothetical protein